MTVSYINNVATVGHFVFTKLLLRWRGSIWQLVCVELLQWCLLYATLSLVYRLALNAEQRKTFEVAVMFADRYTGLIPITFILGFYVSFVISRWWEQYRSIPWIDGVAGTTALYIVGDDERTRQMRRTIIRYAILSSIVTLRNVSTPVLKRFPTWDHVVKAGLMTCDELAEYERINCPYSKHWVPIRWACNIVADARREKRIIDDYLYMKIMQELHTFRGYVGGLIDFDWINVPLVYTQVVNIAVRVYFLACLLGRQYIKPEGESYSQTSHTYIDLYVPPFTILEFIFYMGWLQTAQEHLNPMGEDADDFEMNYILDRNIKVGFMAVDEKRTFYAPLQRDMFWDINAGDIDVPHTEASEGLMDHPIEYSTQNIRVEKEEQRIAKSHSHSSINSDTSHDKMKILLRKVSRAFSRQDTTTDHHWQTWRKKTRNASSSTGSDKEIPMKLFQSQLSCDSSRITAGAQSTKRLDTLMEFDEESRISREDSKSASMGGDSMHQKANSYGGSVSSTTQLELTAHSHSESDIKGNLTGKSNSTFDNITTRL